MKSYTEEELIDENFNLQTNSQSSRSVTAFLSGLYLEGANWDVERETLVESNSSETLNRLPLIMIKASFKMRDADFNNSSSSNDNGENGNEKINESNTINIPVYSTTDRRDAAGNGFVFEANLKCEEHPSYWILKGIALVLNKE